MNYAGKQKSCFELADSAKLSVKSYSRNHKHPDCELLCVISGDISVTIQPQASKVRLHKGDIIAIPAGVFHSIEKNHSLSEFISVRVDMLCSGMAGSAAEAFDMVLQKHFPDKLVISAKEQNVPFEQLFGYCIEEKEKAVWGNDIVIESTLCHILVQMIRHWAKEECIGEEACFEGQRINIHNVSGYIDKHFDEPIRIEALARLCQMSYSHFARRFKALYATGCKEYIERVRIKKARELLLSTNHDLSFISQELGFSDCSHLIRIFKRYEGVTPKQYRISVKENSNCV